VGHRRLGDQVEAAGVVMSFGGSRTPSGRSLGGFDARRVADRLGAPLVAVHRADLHEILVSALPSTVSIQTGRAVTANTNRHHNVGQVVATGPARGHDFPEVVPLTNLDADLIVGADGLGSVVRATFAPEAAVRDSGQVAWRAVVEPPGEVPQRFGETLGRGWRFGAAPLGTHGVYWYAAAPGPLRTTSPHDQLTELRERFAGWHAPIPELLAATPPSSLLHHALVDLHPVPPMRFGDHVALVGDAAHAMTPNLGQGACLALEDAVELAAALQEGIPAGLRRYDAARRPRAAKIVARSWQAGKLTGATGWLPCRLRNLLMLALPDRLTERSAASVANWRPPQALPVPQSVPVLHRSGDDQVGRAQEPRP
jgi:2-polyprenyl-6-methoxyphenol hydroxylase-like FAD-dependent oxidoreductase